MRCREILLDCFRENVIEFLIFIVISCVNSTLDLVCESDGDRASRVMKERPHELVVADCTHLHNVFLLEGGDWVVWHYHGINAKLIPIVHHLLLELNLPQHACLKHIL